MGGHENACDWMAGTGHASVSSKLWQEGALMLPILEPSLVCGMSLGYADPDAIENSLITEREPVDSFTRFIDS